jgi:diguanylate cyclase (GGDEF)-like protein
MSTSREDYQVEAVTRTLVQLNAQADELRTEVLGLQQQLADAQQALGKVQAPELREANENLVLAVLQAETVADSAIAQLNEVTGSTQRDALTKIPNRVLILDRLENAISTAQRHGTQLAVLFLDLDDFKLINDTLGHATGDEALQLTARCLESVVRHSDTVSRYGGDEFLVLLADLKQATDAALVARKILSALAHPQQLDQHELRLSASIGIAIYPQDAVDAVALIGCADAAMYRSKRRQRSSFGFYSDEIIDASSPAPPAIQFVTQPATHSQAAVHDVHDVQFRTLREANEQLVLAMLTAQELEAHAEEVRIRQIGFLATVAHELRGPLTPLRTAAELIGRAHANQPLLEKLQHMIDSQVTQMARLVEDLLDGSRASMGRFRLQPGSTEIADVLNKAIETCRRAMDAQLQHLKINMPFGPLIVQADAVRLTQIFNNLLSNASKYTPKGGEITLTVEVREESLAITVADNGIGITAHALPHIFELFVRDEHAIALDKNGLGIGLAVVRDLVEAHGGTVTATSAGINLGTQFVVTLPLVAELKAATDRELHPRVSVPR